MKRTLLIKSDKAMTNIRFLSHAANFYSTIECLQSIKFFRINTKSMLFWLNKT